MRTVLIIANVSHVSPRIPNFAKYLPEFGWRTIIITAPVGKNPDFQCRIIETEYHDVLSFWKRLLKLCPTDDIRGEVKNRFGIKSKKSIVDYFLTFCGAIINYPDGEKGWKSFAVMAADEVLQHEKVDIIFSCSAPVTSHIIARELKKKYNLPWVADLRDLWSQNHNYGYGTLRRLIDKRLELKTLSNADVLITVSPIWAKKLSILHNGKVTYTITNGFDPASLNILPADLTTKFTITYTGKIYEGKQDTSKLFTALRDLISDGMINPKDVEVRFYGSKNLWLDKEAEQYGLQGIVKQYGIVPKQIATEKERESQLLLLLNWEDQQEIGWYPLKIFGYLAARRPILATGGYGKDEIEKILMETKSGVYCKTIEDIKSNLHDLYFEYKEKNKVNYNGDTEKINIYSYREKTREMAGILDSLI